jgi:hypothetical protein
LLFCAASNIGDSSKAAHRLRNRLFLFTVPPPVR